MTDEYGASIFLGKNGSWGGRHVFLKPSPLLLLIQLIIFFVATLYWSVELLCCCQYTKIYSVSWTHWKVRDDVIIFNRKAADGWDRCRRMHAVHALIKKRVSLGSRINLKHHAWKFRSILNSNKMAADQIVLHSFQFHSCMQMEKQTPACADSCA